MCGDKIILKTPKEFDSPRKGVMIQINGQMYVCCGVDNQKDIKIKYINLIESDTILHR